MKHYSSEALVGIFSSEQVIEIVQNGIRDYSEGKYHIPQRMHIQRGTSTNLIMPAFEEDYYCTKLISVDPNNYMYDLPIISGLLILNNSHTGEALATMDAPMITALRTAAIGSIGLNLICDKNISKLGIIGLGVQGYWQAIFAANTRNIVEIHCHSRNKIKFEAFREKVLAKFPQVSIHWSSTSEAVVEASEAIISCTPSKRPVFEAKGMNISEKRFISIGSFTKDMQELPNEVYIQADAMILDTKAAESEVGDVINTLNNNWIPRENIYTLADILSGKRSVDKHSNVVFKSVGMAAFDLALAIAIYEQNRQK